MRDRTGANNSNWRGGRRRGGGGGKYIVVYAPDHPNAVNGAVLEHRLVMEQHLGRVLDRAEVVHHLNGDTTDNRIENLEILSQADHARLHAPEHLLPNGYRRPKFIVNHTCDRCGDPFTTDRKQKENQRFCSHDCYWAYRREVRGQLTKGMPA